MTGDEASKDAQKSELERLHVGVEFT